MSEDNKKAKSTDAKQNGEPTANRQIVVHAQYIKDLSFENPNAPEILMESPNHRGLIQALLESVQLEEGKKSLTSRSLSALVYLELHPCLAWVPSPVGL